MRRPYHQLPSAQVLEPTNGLIGQADMGTMYNLRYIDRLQSLWNIAAGVVDIALPFNVPVAATREVKALNEDKAFCNRGGTSGRFDDRLRFIS